MLRLLTALILPLILCACYGRANPKTCHAKHVRDKKGSAGAYERCMAEYRRRHPDAEQADYAVVARAPEVDLALRYAPMLIRVTCDTEELAPPSTVKTRLQSVEVVQSCGLVVVDFIGPWREQLVTKRCSGTDGAACAARLDAMAKARVIERYPLADAAWLDNHCTGYPEDCEPFEKKELLYLQHHNAKVLEQWRAAVGRVDAARQRALAAEMAAAQLAEEQQMIARRQAWLQLAAAILSRSR